MKAISKTNELGLTAEKAYEVSEESAGFFKIINDRGDKTWRDARLFIGFVGADIAEGKQNEVD